MGGSQVTDRSLDPYEVAKHRGKNLAGLGATVVGAGGGEVAQRVLRRERPASASQTGCQAKGLWRAAHRATALEPSRATEAAAGTVARRKSTQPSSYPHE